MLRRFLMVGIMLVSYGTMADSKLFETWLCKSLSGAPHRLRAELYSHNFDREREIDGYAKIWIDGIKVWSNEVGFDGTYTSDSGTRRLVWTEENDISNEEEFGFVILIPNGEAVYFHYDPTKGTVPNPDKPAYQCHQPPRDTASALEKRMKALEDEGIMEELVVLKEAMAVARAERNEAVDVHNKALDTEKALVGLGSPYNENNPAQRATLVDLILLLEMTDEELKQALDAGDKAVAALDAVEEMATEIGMLQEWEAGLVQLADELAQSQAEMETALAAANRAWVDYEFIENRSKIKDALKQGAD